MKFRFLILGLLFTFHLRGQQRPTDGEYKEIYQNGELKIQGFYKQGNADSIWTFYFADGKVFKTGTYNDCSYDLGYIKMIPQGIDNEWHERGVENGIWKIYHPNGKLKTEYNSVCGTKTGLIKIFDDKGHLKSESFYSNGEIQIEKEFFDNGLISQMAAYSYTDWEIEEDGNYYRSFRKTVSVFYDTGELEISYTDFKGVFQGQYKMFRKNGFLQYEVNYDKGEENGIERLYYENGLRHSETEYKMGKKHGQSLTYSTDGKIVKKQIWENGVLKTE
jgi:antitoxin component YwqK of YwqJK toxin-antitoxin module